MKQEMKIIFESEIVQAEYDLANQNILSYLKKLKRWKNAGRIKRIGLFFTFQKPTIFDKIRFAKDNFVKKICFTSPHKIVMDIKDSKIEGSKNG